MQPSYIFQILLIVSSANGYTVRCRGRRCSGNSDSNEPLSSENLPTAGNSSPAPPTSLTTCGAAEGKICGDSLCCSRSNVCGSTTEFCQSGCQSKFGRCDQVTNLPTTIFGHTLPIGLTEVVESAPVSIEPESSENLPPTAGNSPPAPPTSLTTCGAAEGKICGDNLCCSRSNVCGSTIEFCQSGCQPKFGRCDQVTNLPTTIFGYTLPIGLTRK